jgi:hypothetical protein
MGNVTSNALVDLDSAAWLADQTSSGSGLTGTGSLSNPQWTLATYHHLYSVLSINNAHLRFLKCMFIEQYAEAALEHEDLTVRRVQSAVFADMFNTFVVETCSRASIGPPLNEWLLDIRSSFSGSELESEISRWKDIVPQLPFTSFLPGTRQTGTEATIESLKDSFLGALSDEIQDEVVRVPTDLIKDKVDTANLKPSPKRIAERFQSGKGVWPRVAKETFIGTVLDKGIDAVVDYAARSENKIEKIVAGGLVVGRAVLSGLDMVAQGVLAWKAKSIPWVGQFQTGAFALSVIEHKEASTKAGEQLARLIYGKDATADLTPEQTEYRESVETIESSSEKIDEVGEREIPAPLQNVSTAECDVVANADLERKEVTMPKAETDEIAKKLFGDPAAARSALGNAASRSQGLLVPDTFRNRQAAAAALLTDYAKRHIAFSDFRQSASSFSFFRTNIAALVRRLPSDRSGSFPAITQAQLMCTAPGFIPIRAAEKNLSTLAALPSLRPLTELGDGIDVEVR